MKIIKNVNTYINKLKALIYTKYYLNEEEKRKKEKEDKDAEEEKRRKEREKRKTQELDKEMWEYKREGEKISNYLNENYLNFRNEYWRKVDITDSINSLGNFTLTKEEKKRKLKIHMILVIIKK